MGCCVGKMGNDIHDKKISFESPKIVFTDIFFRETKLT